MKTIRSYRCTYSPLDRSGWPQMSETGLLPSVRVQAPDAETALRLAFATVGCPIVDAERLDAAAEAA